MPYRVLCPNDQKETQVLVEHSLRGHILGFGNKCPHAWLCLFAVALPILATGVSGYEIKYSGSGTVKCSDDKKVLGGGCHCKLGTQKSIPTTAGDGWMCDCVFELTKWVSSYAICAHVATAAP
jgi:hypothetical protein